MLRRAAFILLPEPGIRLFQIPPISAERQHHESNIYLKLKGNYLGTCTTLQRQGNWRCLGEGREMDSAAILMILFGSVISVTTALTFMEVRRMRKAGIVK
jgi:hypothetical protein